MTFIFIGGLTLLHTSLSVRRNQSGVGLGGWSIDRVVRLFSLSFLVVVLNLVDESEIIGRVRFSELFVGMGNIGRCLEWINNLETVGETRDVMVSEAAVGDVSYSSPPVGVGCSQY